MSAGSKIVKLRRLVAEMLPLLGHAASCTVVELGTAERYCDCPLRRLRLDAQQMLGDKVGNGQ